MIKYYTRACNFYYGKYSEQLTKHKKTLPLNGDKYISFNKVEIFSRKDKEVTSKIIDIQNIKFLNNKIKKKVKLDLRKITSKKNFLPSRTHILMGILNLTPDSFSDGGQFNTKKKAEKKIIDMIKSGAEIIDVGGESTRPGSQTVSSNKELARVEKIIQNFKKKFPKTLLSIDTRKSEIMSKSINYGADIINDVSCFKFDKDSFEIVKNKNIWKIIHHMQGTPKTMQNRPYYKNVLLDIYDFFEREISNFKNNKYKSKIILDPGIGFGKNLKHNLMLLNKVSIFHSLGFPILIGTSRKRFINHISKNFDTFERIGGTLSSILFLFLQGVKLFRVHNVKEVKQGLLVFETLLKK